MKLLEGAVDDFSVSRSGTKDATTGIRSDRDGALLGGGHIKAEIILLCWWIRSSWQFDLFLLYVSHCDETSVNRWAALSHSGCIRNQKWCIRSTGSCLPVRWCHHFVSAASVWTLMLFGGSTLPTKPYKDIVRSSVNTKEIHQVFSWFLDRFQNLPVQP